MELISNWRQVLTRAWSVWLMWVAILIDICREALPFIAEIVPWWLSVAIIAGAVGARILNQDIDKNEQA